MSSRIHDAKVPRRELELVPRLRDQGYDREQIATRRRWIEEKTGATLDEIGAFPGDSEHWRGNVENPIGAACVPLGLTGPMRVCGEHAEGIFYVPMATTEGAMLRSYERGMLTLSKAGGISTRVVRDENRVAPSFHFEDMASAVRFATQVAQHVDDLRTAAEATTRHGKLLEVRAVPIGRDVIVDFRFSTGDASGMNMVVRAADAACRWLREHLEAPHFHVFSGFAGEKRTSGEIMAGGKGKTVIAAARVPRKLVRLLLGVEPADIVENWRRAVLGHQRSVVIGFNAQIANGLAAAFIALGQDVANVTNSAVGITHMELDGEDLHASLTLPSLVVGTVGGG
ncbi:MAG: 3-hydroxy-3-methylglutaryl-CoA reductase, partial [Acidobacteriota bacterium]